MMNADYTVLLDGLTLERVNELELRFLQALDYSLYVKPSDYAKYHFAVQELITKSEINKVLRVKNISPGALERRTSRKSSKNLRSEIVRPFETTRASSSNRKNSFSERSDPCSAISVELSQGLCTVDEDLGMTDTIHIEDAAPSSADLPTAVDVNVVDDVAWCHGCLPCFGGTKKTSKSIYSVGAI